MSIGTVIKKLRSKRDMTQEQLAEYLGITSRAVSQWECDRTAPDISQLPALANIFNVSADELLEIDVLGKEKQIKEIRDNAFKHLINGEFAETERIIRAGLKEYPNSYGLMADLALTLVNIANNYHDNEEKQKEYFTEIKSICEKILDESTDTEARNSATLHLCRVYVSLGEDEKALILANKMPRKIATKEYLLGQILEGTEKYKHIQNEIAADLNRIFDEITQLNMNVLDDGNEPYNCDEQIIIQNKVIDIINILFEDKDFGCFHQNLIEPNLRLTYLYIEKEDFQAALKHFECAANHSILFDKISINQNDNVFSSLLFRGIKSNIFTIIAPNSRTQSLLNKIDNHYFDSLRTFAEFNEIEEKLRKNVL